MIKKGGNILALSTSYAVLVGMVIVALVLAVVLGVVFAVNKTKGIKTFGKGRNRRSNNNDEYEDF